MKVKNLLLAGSITGLLAVILGAFGAHGLEKILDAKTLSTYQTGVEYQFYHSFALIAAGILAHLWPSTTPFRIAGICFLFGIIIFSGSLYLYTFTGIKTFGMITPIGGLSFIAGWILLITGVAKTQ